MVTQGTKQGNFHILQGSTVIGSVFAISQSGSHASNGSSDIPLWHLRLGHMSEKGLDIISKRGLHRNHKVKLLQCCEHYVYGKQHQTKFPKVVHTTKAMLNYFYSDCWVLQSSIIRGMV